MNSLNSVLLEGVLRENPETRETPASSLVCTFTVASDRFYKQDEKFEKEVSCFNVEAWGKLGQTCFQNLRKGRGVRLVGRLKEDRWTDEDGRERSKVKIIAEHVEFKPRPVAAPSKDGEF